MQPKPEALAKERERKLKEETGAEESGASSGAPVLPDENPFDTEEIVGHVKGKIKGSEFKEIVELSGKLYGIHWEHQKRMLDLIELLARDDRQFAVARSQAMSLINSEFINMDVELRQTMKEILRERKLLKTTVEQIMGNHTEKENGNGNRSDGPDAG